MDLANIRKEIDATDDQILSLFLKRMELCVGGQIQEGKQYAGISRKA